MWLNNLHDFYYFFSSLGVRVGLFTPDRAFDMVTKQQIMKLKQPSLKLVDLVCVEIMAISRDITNKVEIRQNKRGRISWIIRIGIINFSRPH